MELKNKMNIFNIFNKNKSQDIPQEKSNKSGILEKMTRAYQMSQLFNSQANWNPSLNSENSELRQNSERMIARSRDLNRNSPIAKRYSFMYRQNVIGAEAAPLQVDAYEYYTEIKDGKKEKQKLVDQDGNDAVEFHWEEWGKKGNCDVTGSYSFKEILDAMATSLCVDGEIFYVKVKEKVNENNPYGFQIQLLDAQRIDNTYYAEFKNGNVVRGGIELDKNGRVLAYHIRQYDTTSLSDQTGTYQTTKRIRLEKGVAELEFKKVFPEQLRGIPPLAVVGKDIKELEDYKDACMSAAKMGASLTVYLEKDETAETKEFAEGQEDDGSYYLKMGASEIMSMPPGHKVQGFQGNYPSEVFVSFTKRSLQTISAGLNVSPLFLGNDTEDVNYSTSRTIGMEERENWKNEQMFFIKNILSPIFEAWLKNGLLRQTITLLDSKSPLPLNKYDKFKIHRFYGKRWDGMDPQKEATAQQIELALNLTTRTQICQENGQDYENILRIKKRESELEKIYGIERIEPKTAEDDQEPEVDEETLDKMNFKKDKK